MVMIVQHIEPAIRNLWLDQDKFGSIRAKLEGLWKCWLLKCWIIAFIYLNLLYYIEEMKTDERYGSMEMEINEEKQKERRDWKNVQ